MFLTVDTSFVSCLMLSVAFLPYNWIEGLKVITKICLKKFLTSFPYKAECQTNSTWSDVDTSETKRSGCTFIAENNNVNVDQQDCKNWVCTQGGNVAEWYVFWLQIH